MYAVLMSTSPRWAGMSTRTTGGMLTRPSDSRVKPSATASAASSVIDTQRRISPSFSTSTLMARAVGSHYAETDEAFRHVRCRLRRGDELHLERAASL